jgi:hypothetical protein
MHQPPTVARLASNSVDVDHEADNIEPFPLIDGLEEFVNVIAGVSLGAPTAITAQRSPQQAPLSAHLQADGARPKALAVAADSPLTGGNCRERLPGLGVR